MGSELSVPDVAIQQLSNAAGDESELLHEQSNNQNAGSKRQQQPRADLVERELDSETMSKKQRRKSQASQAAIQTGLPIVLFDLNGVLVSERDTGAARRTQWKLRPGIEKLLQIRDRYLLGVFSSAQPNNVSNAIQQVTNKVMASLNDKTASSPLFSIVFCRPECAADPTWKDRPGGKHWDTVKPLADNGLPLGQVVLVDNELRKAAPGEQDNMLLLPTWEHQPDLGVAAWDALIQALLALPAYTQGTSDLRSFSPRIQAHIDGAIRIATSAVVNADHTEQQKQQEPQTVADGSGKKTGSEVSKQVGPHDDQQLQASPLPARNGALPATAISAAAAASTTQGVELPGHPGLSSAPVDHEVIEAERQQQQDQGEGQEQAETGKKKKKKKKNKGGGEDALEQDADIQGAAEAKAAKAESLETKRAGEGGNRANTQTDHGNTQGHHHANNQDEDDDAREPPRKLRKTEAQQDVRGAELKVSASGYLLPADQLDEDQNLGGSDADLSESEFDEEISFDSDDLDRLDDEFIMGGDSDTDNTDDSSVDDDEDNHLNIEMGGLSSDDEYRRAADGIMLHSDTDDDDDLFVMKTGKERNKPRFDQDLGEFTEAAPGRTHKRTRSLPGAAPLYNGVRLPGTSAARPHSANQPPEPQHTHSTPQLSGLHYEVAAFAAAAAPSEDFVKTLDAAIAAVQAAAKSVWPSSRAVLFGSQAAGLALPGSDLDVVILGALRDVDTPEQLHAQAHSAKRGLSLLQERLAKTGVMQRYEIIRAKVPIIKARMYVHKLRNDQPWTGSLRTAPTLAVDISIGAANGAAAVMFMQRCVTAVPAVRPLVLVLKALLRDAKLNEVFTGGVSSYAVFNLVTAHLQCEGHSAPVADALNKLLTTDLRSVKKGHAHRNASQGPALASGDTGSGLPTWNDMDDEVANTPQQHQQPQLVDVGKQNRNAAFRPVALDPQMTSYLQLLEQRSRDAPEAAGGGYDLGDLLVAFLYRYAHLLNWGSESVSVRNSGVDDAINDRNVYTAPANHRLAVEDPQQSGRDLCAGSYAWPLVRILLRSALQHVTACAAGSAGHPQIDPCAALPTMLQSQSIFNQQGHQNGYHHRRWGRDSYSHTSHRSLIDAHELRQGCARSVGHVGRLLQRALEALGGGYNPYHGHHFGPSRHQSPAQNALGKLVVPLYNWKGWSAERQPPALLPRSGNAAHVHRHYHAHRLAGQGGQAPHAQHRQSQSTALPQHATEEEMWAAVQAEGSHASPAFVDTAAAQAVTAAGAGAALVTLDIKQRYQHLSGLFDVAHALGVFASSQQQSGHGGDIGPGPQQDPGQAHAKAGPAGSKQKKGMNLTLNADERPTKRKLKIQAAQARRKASAQARAQSDAQNAVHDETQREQAGKQQKTSGGKRRNNGQGQGGKKTRQVPNIIIAGKQKKKQSQNAPKHTPEQHQQQQQQGGKKRKQSNQGGAGKSPKNKKRRGGWGGE